MEKKEKRKENVEEGKTGKNAEPYFSPRRFD